jgi:tetrahydrodipicolinate N-succinyltransferase
MGRLVGLEANPESEAGLWLADEALVAAGLCVFAGVRESLALTGAVAGSLGAPGRPVTIAAARDAMARQASPEGRMRSDTERNDHDDTALELLLGRGWTELRPESECGGLLGVP